MRIDLHADRSSWDRAANEFAPLRPILHRFLVARVHDHHVAEDLTQETLLRGVVHARQLRHPKAALAWLLRIAWHVALDWHRRRLRRRDAWRLVHPVAHDEAVTVVAEPGELECDEERLRSEHCRRALHVALGKLPPLDRVLLIGFHFSGLSCRELARRSRISRDSVKQRLCRSRHRLREWIDLSLLDPPVPLAQTAG
ncbi:MAG: RNA polymerase sigma factor [Planctomycetes bacterium]|nr:RNA polymerase sigma factor [Planctomycetota bacterium]